MKIRLVTPAPRGSRAGNRITARRWAQLLRSLGHEVRVESEYRGGAADVLIALHARKSHPSVLRFRAAHPQGKLVVALSGTDLYGDLGRSAAAHESLALADRVVVLQRLGLEELDPAVRRKTTVILQSAEVAPRPQRENAFEVVVLGHLRPVKDPFRAALASRALPKSSRIEVLHLGRALSPQMQRTAEREMERNPRYHWLGERPRAATMRVLGRARLVVLSSRSEGGANVISEAVSAGVPVLASRIPGSVGLLGPRYGGYFPLGDTRALTRLLRRAEEEPAFLDRLHRQLLQLQPLFRPAHERAAWQKVLSTL